MKVTGQGKPDAELRVEFTYSEVVSALRTHLCDHKGILVPAQGQHELFFQPSSNTIQWHYKP